MVLCLFCCVCVCGVVLGVVRLARCCGCVALIAGLMLSGLLVWWLRFFGAFVCVLIWWFLCLGVVYFGDILVILVAGVLVSSLGLFWLLFVTLGSACEF